MVGSGLWGWGSVSSNMFLRGWLILHGAWLESVSQKVTQKDPS